MRMKALLPVEIETGLFTLLVNATRGQMMEQRLVYLSVQQLSALKSFSVVGSCICAILHTCLEAVCLSFVRLHYRQRKCSWEI